MTTSKHQRQHRCAAPQSQSQRQRSLSPPWRAVGQVCLPHATDVRLSSGDVCHSLVWRHVDGDQEKTLASSRPTAGLDRAAAHTTLRQAPCGRRVVHEIKYDGYRLHLRLRRGNAQLLGVQRTRPTLFRSRGTEHVARDSRGPIFGVPRGGVGTLSSLMVE
jgi:hypothetical protein